MLVDMETRTERVSDEQERERLLQSEQRPQVIIQQAPAPEPTPAPAPAPPAPVDDSSKYESIQAQIEADQRQGQTMLVGLRKRIQELWAVLESDSTDRLHFVMDAEASAAYTPEMIDVY